ncbi:TetR family transcriptional regulator [Nocardia sputorum]|uniref:TetR/AcrR family transcriptional regulator n=1 Tax=Nocardia TaxID=1817 RepID=UPI00249244CB|nr:TetR/AcrR family transcriptional regulator [Nocardia sputorum]BDT91142.1 TetR family transcriptional regulator [Nocardia sputorum]
MSTPRKTPRQQRSEFTFEAILDAAARLFQQQGYAATTTNKIAELAGVSIGTLYHYVPNKDALLYSLAERHLREASLTLLVAAERLRAEQPPLRETIEQLVDAVTRLHTAQPEMHRLLFDQAPRTPDGVERLRQLEQVLAGEVEFHLRRLDVGGADPALTAVLLVQAVEAQIHGAVLDPPAGRTADECGRAIIDLWTGALTPSPGGPAAMSSCGCRAR